MGTYLSPSSWQQEPKRHERKAYLGRIYEPLAAMDRARLALVEKQERQKERVRAVAWYVLGFFGLALLSILSAGL